MTIWYVYPCFVRQWLRHKHRRSIMQSCHGTWCGVVFYIHMCTVLGRGMVYVYVFLWVCCDHDILFLLSLIWSCYALWLYLQILPAPWATASAPIGREWGLAAARVDAQAILKSCQNTVIPQNNRKRHNTNNFSQLARANLVKSNPHQTVEFDRHDLQTRSPDA